MNLSSAQKKIIIAVALVVLVAAVVFFLLIVPKFREMATLDDQISETETQISSAQSLLAQRQEQKARAAQTEAQLLALANELPENPEMASLLVELQDTVNTSGMEFVSIKPDTPEVREEGYTSVRSEMIVRGSWQDLVDLLQRMRRITRQIRILEFEVMPAELDEGVEPETFVIEAKVVTEVYTMSSDLTSTDAVAPAPTD